jgi:hypothetical protein
MTPTTVNFSLSRSTSRPDDSGLAAKLRLPEAVAQDHRAGGTLAIVALDEQAADERLHSQRRKQIGGDRRALDVERLARPEQVRGERVIHADSLENGAGLLPIAIVRGRQLHALVAGHSLPHFHEARGVWKRQRPNQDEVGDRERSGRRADTERDDQDRRDRESWRAAKHADRVGEILPQQVPVDQRGIPGDFRNRSRPHRDRARCPGVAPPAREHGAHLLAVLVAERSRIEMQQQIVETHHAFPGAKPAARAIFTSCASRRASSFAAAVPAAVIR